MVSLEGFFGGGSLRVSLEGFFGGFRWRVSLERAKICPMAL